MQMKLYYKEMLNNNYYELLIGFMILLLYLVL